MNVIFKKQLPRRDVPARRGRCARPAAARRHDAGARAGCVGASPTRMAILYFPNGVQVDTWDHQERRATSRRCRRSCRARWRRSTKYRNDIIVAERADGRTAAARMGDGPGDHGRAGASYLTGAHPEEDLRQGSAGRRVDGSVRGARHRRSQTRFASLELGCEEGIQGGNCDNGYSCAYSNSISWRTPSTPNPPEIRPRAVFERLFGSGESRARSGGARPPGEVPEERARFRPAETPSVWKAPLGASDRTQAGRIHVRGARHRNPHPEDGTAKAR